MTVSGQTLPLSSDTTGNAFDQATSWADLVTGASRSHQIMNLNYIEPVSSEGGVRVSPAPAVVVQGSKDCDFTLVGHFLDSKLPFNVVSSFTGKL